jgi:uncharacterized protein YgiM (DUF1202 family)
MTNRSWALLAMGATLLTASRSHAAATAQSKADRVNVRSRPGYAGEIITQLKRGQQVAVLGTNSISNPAADEPALWFRVALPQDASLWVTSEFLDPATKAVTADVLNVRAGPSIDYAIVARAPKGTVLETHGAAEDGWIEVTAPQGAFGYVPANWVTLDGAAASSAGTTNAPTTASVPTIASTNTLAAIPPGGSSNTVASARAQSPVTPPPTRPSAAADALENAPARGTAKTQPDDLAWAMQFIDGPKPFRPPPTVSTNTPFPPTSGTRTSSMVIPPTSAVVAPDSGTHATAEVSPKTPSPDTAALPPTTTAATAGAAEPTTTEGEARRVRREGLVIRPSNIVAPSYYALEARDTGQTINFLLTSRPEPINWREYRGKVVIVTGREYLDSRKIWRGIPILDVEEIEAVR